MGNIVTVGVGQIGSDLGNVKENVQRCVRILEQAAEQEISLIVLPECALSGYIFDSFDSAKASAVKLSGPEVVELAEHCNRLRMYCVVGLLEDADETVYNTAILLGPEGVIGSYRKTHLPYLGVDRFVTLGNMSRLPVFDTSIGRIGLAICYDIRFPEVTRTLALAGADIIAHPSNWPPQSHLLAEHFTIVRASENRVFVLVANRWDLEQGVHFMGQSQIVSASGELLTRAGTEEALLSANIDIDIARSKHVVIEPSVFEISLLDDRRPELYGPITARQANVDALPAQK